MANHQKGNDRLDGWEAISDYLGWHPRTVIRWEKQKGLPVHRISGGKRQPVYAFRNEIDQWFQKSGGVAPVFGSLPGANEQVSLSTAASPVVPAWRTSRFRVVAAVSALALLASVLGYSWRLNLAPVIQITGITQLTDDGTGKHSLVTDGKEVYFSEEVGNQQLLSTMAISGGPIRRLSLPILNPDAQDLSRDGRFLLVTPWDAPTDEHSLWVVPTAGGPPYQLAGIRCGAASWSPNGELIAFGSGAAVFVTSRDGERTRLLTKLSGYPLTIRWSDDGNQLLVLIQSLPATTTSLWQIGLDHDQHVVQTVPVQLKGAQCCGEDLLAEDPSGYFSITNDPTGNQLLHLSPHPYSPAGSYEATTISTHFEHISGLAANAYAHKLFVLSNSHVEGELVQYDPSSLSFKLLLPGSSATFLDYSKDMNLITYVKSPERTLWVSRFDGSDARQLSPVGMEVELPRFSPDRKQVAFMGKQSDHPWRIFIVQASGGTAKEATESDDGQGAPTWSPNGKLLIYGNVDCQKDRTCALHKIDLSNGGVTVIPASQGLSTARWSPDGRHIAALNSIQNELLVFDFDTRHWRKLAEGINGNDVSWSSDSRYVYSKTSMSGRAAIVRVVVEGGPLQTVLNLDLFSNSTGKVDTWFSLAPDNALILNRWLDTSEIYELSYAQK